MPNFGRFPVFFSDRTVHSPDTPSTPTISHANFDKLDQLSRTNRASVEVDDFLQKNNKIGMK